MFIIRGKDQGCPAWHYILVSNDKLGPLKRQAAGETIDITKFGRVIEYRDKNGTVRPASDWGPDPSKEFKDWIEEEYGGKSSY